MRPLPRTTGTLPGLNHLRVLAIALVFLFHYRLFAHPAWVDAVGSFGWTGVDLFFVLSGYLIASQVFKEVAAGAFSLRAFFVKRSFRILPAYWTVLALYVWVPPFREWERLPPLWKLLTFTQNFGLDLRVHRTFSHAWSLCIEEQFYLLLPFTVLLLRRLQAGRNAVWLLPALSLAGLACRLFSWTHFIAPAQGTADWGALWYRWIYYPTYNRLDGLLVGIALAAVFQYAPRWSAWMVQNAKWLAVAGILLLAGASTLCDEPTSFSASLFGFPLVALAYGCLVAAAVGRRRGRNGLASALSSRLAAWSYAIYLTHKAAIHATQIQAAKLHWATDSTPVFVASVVVSVAAALLLHYGVERPFLALRHQLLQKRFGKSGPGSSRLGSFR